MTHVTSSEKNTLRYHVTQALNRYFSHLEGQDPVQLYEFVLEEVEEPLFRLIMNYAEGNQCRAADMLGISRGTLRTKLKKYGLL